MLIKEKDNRLFLNHGPIDIVLEAFGKDKPLAYEKAKNYFTTLLNELVLDMDLLKKKWFRTETLITKFLKVCNVQLKRSILTL